MKLGSDRRGVLANDALLLLTAAIWGFAFVAQRAGMEHLGPLWFTAVRFALGSLSLVPLVLLRHYVRKFGEPYLARQVWLDPHPAELSLRNHV